MPGLYDWYLVRYENVVLAKGTVYGHPKSKLPDGMFIHTSAVQEAAAEEGGLVLKTHSGSRYFLRPEEINPGRGEDTAYALARFGIGGGFVEDCLQARREADARSREEEERMTEPEELLLTAVGTHAIRALFRTAGGAPVRVEPSVHAGLFQDSVLITDWEGGTVDFRYFPMGDFMEPYHISDGLRTVKVRNLGKRAVYFGKTGREAVCPPGEITAIPAAEHDHEGLFFSGAVNGKGLYQTMLSNDGEEPDGGIPGSDGERA